MSDRSSPVPLSPLESPRAPFVMTPTVKQQTATPPSVDIAKRRAVNPLRSLPVCVRVDVACAVNARRACSLLSLALYREHFGKGIALYFRLGGALAGLCLLLGVISLPGAWQSYVRSASPVGRFVGHAPSRGVL